MIPLFEANLFTNSNVGSDYQVKALLEEINSIRHFPSSEATNDNCWRNNHRYTGIEWLLSSITGLVSEAINYYSKDIVFSNNIKKDNLQINYWTNINRPLSRNVFHSHKTSVFSGVYYIQGFETGSLRMCNPANILGDCNNLSPFTRDFYFKPKNKDLILWPSWVPHEVEVNDSEQERINIAFDII